MSTKVSFGNKCCVEFCNKSRSRSSKLSFFRFPKDAVRRAQWIENCCLIHSTNKNIPLKHSRVCGEHFEDKMFLNINQKNRLTFYAVPTLFNDEILERRAEAKRHRMSAGLSNSSCPSPKSCSSQICVPSSSNLPLVNSNDSPSQTPLHLSYNTPKQLKLVNDVQRQNEKIRIPPEKSRSTLWMPAIQSFQPSFIKLKHSRIYNSSFIKSNNYIQNNCLKLGNDVIPNVFISAPSYSLKRSFDLPNGERNYVVSDNSTDNNLGSDIALNSTSEVKNDTVNSDFAVPVLRKSLDNLPLQDQVLPECNKTVNSPTSDEKKLQYDSINLNYSILLQDHQYGKSPFSEQSNLKLETKSNLNASFTDSSKNICTKSTKKMTYCMSDFSEEDLNCPLKRKKYWYVSQKVYSSQKSKLKTLINKNHHFEIRLKTMKKLVNHLQDLLTFSENFVSV